MSVISSITVAVLISAPSRVTGRRGSGGGCRAICRHYTWWCHLTLFTILLEFHKHVSQFMVTQVHLDATVPSEYTEVRAPLHTLTLPPKWSARRRSESRTDRYAPQTSQTRSFWCPDAPEVSVSCCNSR